MPYPTLDDDRNAVYDLINYQYTASDIDQLIQASIQVEAPELKFDAETGQLSQTISEKIFIAAESVVRPIGYASDYAFNLVCAQSFEDDHEETKKVRPCNIYVSIHPKGGYRCKVVDAQGHVRIIADPFVLEVTQEISSLIEQVGWDQKTDLLNIETAQINGLAERLARRYVEISTMEIDDFEDISDEEIGRYISFNQQVLYLPAQTLHADWIRKRISRNIRESEPNQNPVAAMVEQLRRSMQQWMNNTVQSPEFKQTDDASPFLDTTPALKVLWPVCIGRTWFVVEWLITPQLKDCSLWVYSPHLENNSMPTYLYFLLEEIQRHFLLGDSHNEYLRAFYNGQGNLEVFTCFNAPTDMGEVSPLCIRSAPHYGHPVSISLIDENSSGSVAVETIFARLQGKMLQLRETPHPHPRGVPSLRKKQYQNLLNINAEEASNFQQLVTGSPFETDLLAKVVTRKEALSFEEIDEGDTFRVYLPGGYEQPVYAFKEGHYDPKRLAFTAAYLGDAPMIRAVVNWGTLITPLRCMMDKKSFENQKDKYYALAGITGELIADLEKLVAPFDKEAIKQKSQLRLAIESAEVLSHVCQSLLEEVDQNPVSREQLQAAMLDLKKCLPICLEREEDLLNGNSSLHSSKEKDDVSIPLERLDISALIARIAMSVETLQEHLSALQPSVSDEIEDSVKLATILWRDNPFARLQKEEANQAQCCLLSHFLTEMQTVIELFEDRQPNQWGKTFMGTVAPRYFFARKQLQMQSMFGFALIINLRRLMQEQAVAQIQREHNSGMDDEVLKKANAKDIQIELSSIIRLLQQYIVGDEPMDTLQLLLNLKSIKSQQDDQAEDARKFANQHKDHGEMRAGLHSLQGVALWKYYVEQMKACLRNGRLRIGEWTPTQVKKFMLDRQALNERTFPLLEEASPYALVTDGRGNTLLHAVCYGGGSLEVCELLITTPLLDVFNQSLAENYPPDLTGLLDTRCLQADYLLEHRTNASGLFFHDIVSQKGTWVIDGLLRGGYPGIVVHLLRGISAKHVFYCYKEGQWSLSLPCELRAQGNFFHYLLKEILTGVEEFSGQTPMQMELFKRLLSQYSQQRSDFARMQRLYEAYHKSRLGFELSFIFNNKESKTPYALMLDRTQGCWILQYQERNTRKRTALLLTQEEPSHRPLLGLLTTAFGTELNNIQAISPNATMRWALYMAVLTLIGHAPALITLIKRELLVNGERYNESDDPKDIQIRRPEQFIRWSERYYEPDDRRYIQDMGNLLHEENRRGQTALDLLNDWEFSSPRIAGLKCELLNEMLYTLLHDYKGSLYPLSQVGREIRDALLTFQRQKQKAKLAARKAENKVGFDETAQTGDLKSMPSETDDVAFAKETARILGIICKGLMQANKLGDDTPLQGTLETVTKDKLEYYHLDTSFRTLIDRLNKILDTYLRQVALGDQQHFMHHPKMRANSTYERQQRVDLAHAEQEASEERAEQAERARKEEEQRRKEEERRRKEKEQELERIKKFLADKGIPFEESENTQEQKQETSHRERTGSQSEGATSSHEERHSVGSGKNNRTKKGNDKRPSSPVLNQSLFANVEDSDETPPNESSEPNPEFVTVARGNNA